MALQALVILVGLLLSGCAPEVTTRTVAVVQPLPRQETARYRLFDTKGALIGSAVLTIEPEGDDARLGLVFEEERTGLTDSSSIVVLRQSMRPLRWQRSVVEGDRRYITTGEYTAQAVSVSLEDGARARRREAEISDTTYDNIGSVFLWRTMDHSVGTEVRYVNVVVDPKRGTISRALGTAEVIGREEVRLPSGPVQAWRVAFRSAGVTNTAWYRADAGHALVRYEVMRGPTLILDSVGP